MPKTWQCSDCGAVYSVTIHHCADARAPRSARMTRLLKSWLLYFRNRKPKGRYHTWTR